MTVREAFETMEYGPAPEGRAEADAWLDRFGRRFGAFVGGAFAEPGETFETVNPATGEVLAEVTQTDDAALDRAVAAGTQAQADWAGRSGHERARVLYALARIIQKRSRLFAVLETLDNGKPIRESRDLDVPLAARHFTYHAGMAQLLPAEWPDRVPHGVCAQIVPWNFPLLMLAWKVAPALAAGNAVVLKPAEQTPLTALLFADICAEAGVPPGLVNIVTGDGRVGAALAAHDGVAKVAFTGSTEVGRAIRRATAGQGTALTLELGGKSPYIVFDDADLDSAVEGLVDAIWLNQGQVCCAGSRLLVHEPVADDFHARLRARMGTLRLGDPLDKCIDVGAMISIAERDRVAGIVAGAPGEVFRAECAIPGRGAFHPPTLITGAQPSDAVMQEEIFGPVLVSTTFRTPAEAVSLANDTRYGLAATVWSENVNLALDMAPKLAAGIVWVNATNLFDAAAPFGGVRESGFGREGGWAGMRHYTRPGGAARPIDPVGPVPRPDNGLAEELDRTPKLYVGGKQARPDGGHSRAIWGPDGSFVGHAPEANRKDVRNAVEAARNAAAWSRATAHNRAQVIYYLAENLAAREAEFAGRLAQMTGKDGAAEVAAGVERLFHWAAWADKHDGAAAGVPLRGLALALNEPVGVVGILAPDDAPLLGLVSVLGPALAMGNRAVVVASEPYPLVATDLALVLDQSDVPAGAANILTGRHTDLAPHLAGHADVDAVWSFSSSDVSATIEREAAGNLKRAWVNHGRARDWWGPPGRSAEFLDATTEVKTVWVPYGE